jgi:hypothetical protein
MGLLIRRVPTASGATAVQVVDKRGTRLRVVEHVGSARTREDLSLLLARADQVLHQGEQPLFESTPASPLSLNVQVTRTYSGLLWDQLGWWWNRLGFDRVDDEVFRQVVLARVVEPTSKADSIRVMEDLGVSAPSEAGIHRALRRCQEHDYRGRLSDACWAVSGVSGTSQLMYDVTTLWFEIHEEDAFRKPGFSKERRLEPQILVGLLVDASGFPLWIDGFQGNKAETLTMLPVLRAFADRHDLGRITVTADAGMLSDANLAGVEQAGFDFVVGSRTSKFPYLLDEVARTHPGEGTTDGQILCWSIPTPKGLRQRTLIMHYRAVRARLDLRNIDKQAAKARQIAAGDRPAHHARFLSVKGGVKHVNQPLIDRAVRLAGWKGYVTNLPVAGTNGIIDGCDPHVLIDAYHQQFEVERSFRMSKSDLKARPIFHHLVDAIQAHLTIVFAALAISRSIQADTGMSIRRWRNALRPLRTAEITINGKTITIPPAIPEQLQPYIKGVH